MTIPTNWPNPERPGVPMFPERDGWHMTTHSGATSPTVSFWRASEEVWKSGASSYPPDYLGHPLRKYIGPVITPTQLTELLEGSGNAQRRKHKRSAINITMSEKTRIMMMIVFTLTNVCVLLKNVQQPSAT